MGTRNIDLEHCEILGNETVDANSLNRCMFNLHRKMVDAATASVEATSENVPSSPFFSGGYDNALTDIDYVTSVGAVSATTETAGLVSRLYRGDLDVEGSQNNPSFATEGVTGTYYYTIDELNTFAPTVDALFNDSQRILGPVLQDDTTTMVEGVSSLGIASSPIVKFTSYMTCAKSGVSFGTITFKHNNGDRQHNVVTLNIPRDLVGIEGIDTVDFMTIGNGFASGVRKVSEGLDMVSDIGQCTITYLTENDIAITDITKSDNSNSIYVERESGRIVESMDNVDYSRYVELSNDDVILNFFIIFTLKNEVLEYSDDLWCFYIVNDFDYGRLNFHDASRWAMDYYKYSFSNFEAADDGKVGIDGSHIVDTTGGGCITDATDAFNGCYNATFESLWWFSPSLAYADRMFKGCSHATFDSLSSNLTFERMRSSVSMFERCKEATFGNVTTICLPTASQTAMMFASCDKASFDLLRNITVAGNATKMFYGDYSADFTRLESIAGSGNRFNSMFEGCDNASFDVLHEISSDETAMLIDATKMFFDLKKPTFSAISSIDLGHGSETVCGYDGVSMFEGCINATFENLTSIGNVVDGTRMFANLDPEKQDSPKESRNMEHCTFSQLNSLGPKIVNGTSMFMNNYYLDMNIHDENCGVMDGTSMFMNTSSVIFHGNLPNLVTATNMMSHINHAEVRGDMNSLRNGEEMFENDGVAIVLGEMPVLKNAHSMFLGSNQVTLTTFPSSVEDAFLAFSDIGGKCDIMNWEAATSDRYCDDCFYGSNNISVTGDIIAGHTVSTSNMFNSANGVRIVNSGMTSVSEVSSKWYYFDGVEHYAYVQKFDEDGEQDGDLVFIGNVSINDIASSITSSLSSDFIDSLLVFADLKNNDVRYSIYVASLNGESAVTAELICKDVTFEDIYRHDSYAYASVVGYVASIPEMSKDGVLMMHEYVSGDTYYYYLGDDAMDEHRMYEVDSNVANNYFTLTGYGDYDALSTDSILQATVSYSTDKLTITLDDQESASFTIGTDATISFDFAQFETISGNGNVEVNLPQITVVATKGNVVVGAFGMVPSSMAQSGERIVELDGSKLLWANAQSHVDVDTVVVNRTVDNVEEPYGYLIRYVDAGINDNRIGFTKMGSYATTVLNDMLEDPKRKIDKYGFMAAQIFTDYDINDDIGHVSNGSSRVRTHFAVSNATLPGYWKQADGMFKDVVQDSLLSGYYCFTDTSLEDVEYMFALSEKVDDDHTFDNSGPLMANLHRSNVRNMTGMFENRTVSYPVVFKDTVYSIGAEDGLYVSFPVPYNVTDAASAFHNCTILGTYSDDGAEKTVSEVGVSIPQSLVNAQSMFEGYVGPKIRFGYDSNGYVTIGDGLNCDRMFYGCEFVNDSNDRYGFNIPTIYLDMFEGSDFSMSSVTSIDVRNGMNFTTPYSSDMFFNNDMKMLGCSSLEFDSLKTDVLDWFCTDDGGIEGVYLATVIGPKNTSNEDYRLMVASQKSDTGQWNLSMAQRGQFNSNAMIESLYAATNSVHLNSMDELSNTHGRMTCMFNLPILFSVGDVDSPLGSNLPSMVSHGSDSCSSTFNTYGKNGAYVGKTYNTTTFASMSSINAVEMPFAFAGCTGASFESLESIGPSPVMAYGAFMSCSGEDATFGSLKNVTFMQDGDAQYGTMKSRFVSNMGSVDWYGNYCNMFTGCSNATFENLESITMNTKFADYGVDDAGRVVMWYGSNGSLNYTSSLTADINFNVRIGNDDNNYTIDVKSNSTGSMTSSSTGVAIDDNRTWFRMDMAEINGILTAIVVITDKDNVEHVFEILPNGDIEPLNKHPSTGEVEELGGGESVIMSAFAVEEGGETAFLHDIPYSDRYGQNFTIYTDSAEDEYTLVLCKESGTPGTNGDGIIVLHAPEFKDGGETAKPTDVKFRIAPYLSDGQYCVIVSIKYGNDGVFYKIYDEIHDGRKYAIVEETIYDPTNRFEYRLLESMEFGPSHATSNICFATNMFHGCSSANFNSLATICLPGVGSCAGMFSGCDSLTLSALDLMVLPTSKTGSDADYEGIFSGIDASNINLENLDVGHTNIHALGGNDSLGRTNGYALFKGITGIEGFIDSAEKAYEYLGLGMDIGNCMVWPLLEP